MSYYERKRIVTVPGVYCTALSTQTKPPVSLRETVAEKMRHSIRTGCDSTRIREANVGGRQNGKTSTIILAEQQPASRTQQVLPRTVGGCCTALDGECRMIKNYMQR